MIIKKIRRKIKFSVWIPRHISRIPKLSGSVISDLFPLRIAENWKTHFELLDVQGLIAGDNSFGGNKSARFIFFDEEGNQVGEKLCLTPASGRSTIELSSEFHHSISKAATFAVFHEGAIENLNLEESFLAERGYTCYSRLDSEIRAYVHGNFDSLAYKKGKIQAIGNKGFLPRFYTVQHPLRGPANYEFFLSNPTPHSVKVKIFHGAEDKKWCEIERFKLRSKGSRIFKVDKSDDKATFIRIRSQFYLGRPVVFRSSGRGLDVFHG